MASHFLPGRARGTLATMGGLIFQASESDGLQGPNEAEAPLREQPERDRERDRRVEVGCCEVELPFYLLGSRGQEKGCSPDSWEPYPEGCSQDKSTWPCAETHGGPRMASEAHGRRGCTGLRCRGRLGGRTTRVVILQAGPSLVVKSAKPLPSHFFFW